MSVPGDDTIDDDLDRTTRTIPLEFDPRRGTVMDRPAPSLEATLTVRVPLGAAGGLVDGATATLERVDAVDRVGTIDVTAVSPGLNDTAVDCRVRLEFADPVEEDLARTALEDGVGALGVESVDPIEDGPLGSSVLEAERG
ncbi:hypothetical protein [Natronococcus roseus]|uniref:hypothetical protein n=1 Tax=Natronococcus roseus TaxID=1052014 RepID=UPI00374CC901